MDIGDYEYLIKRINAASIKCLVLNHSLKEGDEVVCFDDLISDSEVYLRRGFYKLLKVKGALMVKGVGGRNVSGASSSFGLHKKLFREVSE